MVRRPKKERFLEDSEVKLLKWFKKLTPEQRLDIALEIEELRRGARFVKSKRSIRSTKRK